ncbi:arabinose efflux permease family protein [Synechococcus sp. PCC 7502]|uniref:MFS transporter n=1 Tax=Synechococcus sp. PCC 7502 TaxID=1173263 RepID=UPI00029FCE34|nr:MFS transporter [Synechococcus sp. PCC 7502]AFY74939.1 arabinose efflux permease family protein [Synechococcus sp. PCC 7502]
MFKTLREIPIDLRHQLISAFVVGLMFWSSLASQLPTLPLYIKYLGGTTTQIGLVMGSFAIGLLFCRSYLGQMADRKGRVVMIWLGLSVAALIPLFYTTFRTIPILVVLRALHGISIAAFATAFSALVADLAPPSHRGEIIGYMSLVQPLGIGLGPALGGWMQETFGYTPLFITASALAAIGLVTALGLRESSDFIRPQGLQVKLRIWSTLASPRVKVPAMVLLLVGIVFGILSSFLPLTIQEYKIPLNAGIFYMTTALSGFMVRLPLSTISDRFGRGVFISIGLCFYALAMLVIATVHSRWAVLGAGILEGIGSGIVIPSIMTLLSDRTLPKERGFIFGLAWLGFDLGMASCSPIIGSLIKVIGLSGAFMVASGMAVLALIIFMTQSSSSLKTSFLFAISLGKDPYSLMKEQLAHDF